MLQQDDQQQHLSNGLSPIAQSHAPPPAQPTSTTNSLSHLGYTQPPTPDTHTQPQHEQAGMRRPSQTHNQQNFYPLQPTPPSQTPWNM